MVQSQTSTARLKTVEQGLSETVRIFGRFVGICHGCGQVDDRTRPRARYIIDRSWVSKHSARRQVETTPLFKPESCFVYRTRHILSRKPEFRTQTRSGQNLFAHQPTRSRVLLAFCTVRPGASCALVRQEQFAEDPTWSQNRNIESSGSFVVDQDDRHGHCLPVTRRPVGEKCGNLG